MKRTEVIKRIRRAAKIHDAKLTLDEGPKHTRVFFDGRKVTEIPRHNEINEYTARGAIRDAEHWEA